MDESFKNGEDELFKNGIVLKPFPYVKFGISAGLGIFFFYQVFGGTALLLLEKSGFKNALAWVQGFVQVAAMLLPTLWLARRTPLGFKKLLRLENNPSWRQWVFGLLGIFAIQFFALGFETLQESILPESILHFYKSLETEIDELYTRLLGSSTLLGLLRALLIGAVIPAVAEELLFRGVMQRSLEEAMPFKKAIILTGIIFGAIHFNLPVFIPLVIIGMYLGALAYYSQSIILPIAAHFFNNALSIIGLYQESGPMSEITLGQAAIFTAFGAVGMAICLSQVLKKEPLKF
jgi:membrane protease YdiL (CAAX protease family)